MHRLGYHQPTLAHPRVSGENPARKPAKKFTAGSSPRERGKPLTYRYGHFIYRLIPA